MRFLPRIPHCGACPEILCHDVAMSRGCKLTWKRHVKYDEHITRLRGWHPLFVKESRLPFGAMPSTSSSLFCSFLVVNVRVP